MIVLFKRWRLTWLAVLSGAAAIAFSMHLMAADQIQTSAEKSATVHVVNIKNMQFSPNKLQVRVGDEITWINKDIVPHTATAMDKSWDSSNLARGESYSLIVDEETLTEYFCVYHPNMVAQIEIITSE